MSIGKSDPLKRVNAGSTDRAVSPVIGVILMVAITVILAAVIGVFVMGLGDEIGESAPSAQLSFSEGDANNTIDVEHSGGDAFDRDAVTILVNGSVDDNANFGGSGDFASGETDTITIASGSAGDDVTIAIRDDDSEELIAQSDVTVGS